MLFFCLGGPNGNEGTRQRKPHPPFLYQLVVDGLKEFPLGQRFITGPPFVS